MRRGVIVNILIGITIALLPLYIRIGAYDFQRTAKDNLLVIIFGFLGFLLPSSVRKVSWSMLIALVYALFFLVINQWNILSINVMFQTFYICTGLLFLFSYYEKHDAESTHFILNGMIAGSLIQSVLAIPGYWGIDLYRMAIVFLTGGNPTIVVPDGQGAVIGSLGNINLTASYLSLTLMAFLDLKKLRYLVIIPIAALLLNGSLMGIFAAIAGACYYLNLKFNFVKKWKIYTAAISAMIIYPLSGIGHDSGRIEIWKNVLGLNTLKGVIFGNGAGWFPDQKLVQIKDVILVQEHNEYLAFFNIFGLLGIIVIAPMFYKFITTEDKGKIFPSILFVAFCNSYGHFAIHQSTSAIIIIVTAAICLAGGKK